MFPIVAPLASFLRSSTVAWGMPMGGEWIVIAVFGLLIFGKRLPEVGKGVGQAYANFRRGLTDVQREIDVASIVDPKATAAEPRKIATSLPAPAPKFDPYTGRPLEAETAAGPEAVESTHA